MVHLLFTSHELDFCNQSNIVEQIIDLTQFVQFYAHKYNVEV